MRRGRVAFDGFGRSWPAEWDDDERWNGYIADPSFDREAAESIAAMLDADPEEACDWRWDGDALVETYRQDPSMTERHEPGDDGRYRPWSHGWTWLEAPPTTDDLDLTVAELCRVVDGSDDPRCLLCGRPVDVVSAGLAHAFGSPDELVAHDWSDTRHEPVLPVPDGAAQ